MERVAQVLKDYPEIAAAWVFGSVARGEARPDSDLDLGLLFRERGATAADHHLTVLDIAARLEDLGRRVDVVVLEPQGPIFCHAVLREGQLVYDADPERRVDFVSDTIVRYLDFKPTWDLMHEGRVGAMRRWLETR